MRTLVFGLALVLLIVPVQAIRTLPYALQFADNSSDVVASAAIPSNPQLGTLLFLFTPIDVANAARQIGGKSSSGIQQVAVSRRAVDGAQMRLNVGRSTSTQNVDTPAGGLKAGVPTCTAFQWDIAGGAPTSYLGVGSTPLADVTTSAGNGSGTHTSTNATYFVGRAPSSTNSGAMQVWAFTVAFVRLSLGEMRAWCDDPTTPLRAQDVLWFPGAGGTFGPVLDYSGHGWHGARTSAVVAVSPLILPRAVQTARSFPGVLR